MSDTNETTEATSTDGPDMFGGHRIIRRTRREVSVQLSNDESRQYGKQLARRKIERDAVEEKRKGVNAQFKGQLAEKDSEIDRLTAAIDTGSELRSLDVFDVLAGSQVITYRVDTHELVDQRPASYEQADMFPELVEPDDDEDEAGAYAEENGTNEPVGEMAVSAVGDAVFVGGDGEEQEDAPAKKPRKAAKKVRK